jgi:hypothetical protein
MVTSINFLPPIVANFYDAFNVFFAAMAVEFLRVYSPPSILGPIINYSVT